jgi:hypothetical protein
MFYNFLGYRMPSSFILKSCISMHMHNILEPTTGITFFNNGFKSDPTKLFPFIILVTTG